jgi:hypothetical protein
MSFVCYMKNYLLVFNFHYLENKLYEETLNFSFVTFKNPVMHKIIMLFVVDNRHFEYLANGYSALYPLRFSVGLNNNMKVREHLRAFLVNFSPCGYLYYHYLCIVQHL